MGLVHLLYLTPNVPEFSLDRSWLVPKSVRRPVAMVLMWATVAGFALPGLAVWGGFRSGRGLAGNRHGRFTAVPRSPRRLLELVAGLRGAHRPGLDRRGGDPPGVDGQDRRVSRMRVERLTRTDLSMLLESPGPPSAESGCGTPVVTTEDRDGVTPPRTRRRTFRHP